jgi:hypothetical protein
MKNEATTFYGGRERIRVAQVARNALHSQFADLAARTTERANVVAALSQEPGHVPADKSTGASD